MKETDAALPACRLAPPAEQVAALVALLAHEIERDEAAAFRGCPLTPPQYVIAASLAGGGPLMITELARAGCCVPGNVTALVDRLELKGFAQRIPDPTDRRVIRVGLTDAGRRAFEETASQVSGRGDRLAAALTGIDPWTLIDLLGRLYVDLTGPGQEAPEGERQMAPPQGPGNLGMHDKLEEPR